MAYVENKKEWYGILVLCIMYFCSFFLNYMGGTNLYDFMFNYEVNLKISLNVSLLKYSTKVTSVYPL